MMMSCDRLGKLCVEPMTPSPKITAASVALNTGASGDRFPQGRFILHLGDQGFPLAPIRGGPGRRIMPPLMVCFRHSPRVEEVRMQFNWIYSEMVATGQVRAAAGPSVLRSCAA